LPFNKTVLTTIPIKVSHSSCSPFYEQDFIALQWGVGYYEALTTEPMTTTFWAAHEILMVANSTIHHCLCVIGKRWARLCEFDFRHVYKHLSYINQQLVSGEKYATHIKNNVCTPNPRIWTLLFHIFRLDVTVP